MALINRLTRLVKADFHAVLDTIEEPEQLLKQAIRDMEDSLAETEQRIILCTHDQEALGARCQEMTNAIDEINTQLDLCFASGKDELARSLIKKKLEAERILKRLSSKYQVNEKYLDEQRKLLDENRSTMHGLRQKADLFAQRTPITNDGTSEFDDIAWMARDMQVGDDEIEIAFLREKDAREAS